MTESEERAAVVAEARKWLGTPYHHAARVRGAGCDCMTLLLETFSAVGLVSGVELPEYTKDWNLHRSAEIYLDGLFPHAARVDEPKTGDIAMYRFGRAVSHAALVVEWPEIIHCQAPSGVILADGEKGLLSGRLHGFYSHWGRR